MWPQRQSHMDLGCSSPCRRLHHPRVHQVYRASSSLLTPSSLALFLLHRMTERPGLGGALKSSLSKTPDMDKDTRLLPALSKLPLNTSRGGTSTISPGNASQCLVLLTLKVWTGLESPFLTRNLCASVCRQRVRRCDRAENRAPGQQPAHPAAQKLPFRQNGDSDHL